MNIWLLSCFLVLGLFGSTNAEKEMEWWETTVFYQIFPRSFMDSDGDGVGDLNGITSKLEYLKELGIGATWLSPIFKSPMYDLGYDVSDFYAIHEEYGTMEDFERMLQKANELDIKIVLDFVPNHTSNESVWFQKALQGDEKYFDYFVWDDGVVDENGTLQPPNNWVSVFRKSAWEYKEEVGKFYLHQFVIGQPDLDFRNPEVIEEMNNVIQFWLGKGVAGFRIDAVIHMFEAYIDGKYPDEPRTGKLEAGPDDYNYLDHIYTTNQEDVYDLIYQWRELFDEISKKDGVTRVMMTEGYSTPIKISKYFGDEEREGAQIPFNFALISDLNEKSTAADIKYAVDQFITYKPIDKTANWVLGNHDNSRVASRLSPALVDGFNMLALLLPGIGVTYMGEEIGMRDGFVSWEDTVDPGACNTDDPINYWVKSRDPVRTPFQWNAELNAGFSTASKTWLPVADNYTTLNVEAQTNTAKSHLNIYKSLVALRKEVTFRKGRYESVALNKDVFAFRRWLNGETYIVLINMKEREYNLDLTYFENITGDLEIVITSIQSLKNTGDKISAENVPLAGVEALVLKVKE